MHKINKWIRNYNNFWDVIIKLNYNGVYKNIHEKVDYRLNYLSVFLFTR